MSCKQSARPQTRRPARGTGSRWHLQIPERKPRNRDRHHSGRVRAQRHTTERHRQAARLLRSGPFFRGPSALRADNQCQGSCGAILEEMQRTCLRRRRHRFDEHQSKAMGARKQPLFEGARCGDRGDDRAPALFCRGNTHARPPIILGSRDSRDRPLGDDRLDRGNSHHRRVTNNVVHLVALQHSLHERDWNPSFRSRCDGLEQFNRDLTSRDANNPGAKLVTTAVEDCDVIARVQPQHAREMCRLVGG